MLWLGICMILAAIALVGMWFQPSQDSQNVPWWVLFEDDDGW